MMATNDVHMQAEQNTAGAGGQSPPPGPIDQRILFAAGIAGNYRQLESELIELEPGWQIQHAPDRASTLEALKSSPFDALVVEADFDGVEPLLEETEGQFPLTTVILSYDPATQMNLEVLKRSGRKLLARSRETIDVADAIKTHLQVRHWMSDPFIAKLLARIRTLPALPRLHTQVTAELQSPDGSLEVVAEHVRRDPVMAAKFLHLVNSAFFARPCPITDPGEAVMFLGAEQTRALILMAGVFSQFDNVQCPGFSPEQVWGHSLQVGSLARGIALVATEDPRLGELAYTAGLLHDLGKLILAANVPAMCGTVQQLQKNKEMPLREAELAVFGASHGELGACLLGSWALPFRILEAVAWHNSPNRAPSKGFSVLTAVHVANVFAHEMGEGSNGRAVAYLDALYLEKAGLNQQIKTWREACGIPSRR